MDSSILPLRSFAILSLPAILGLLASDPPVSGEGLVSRGPDTSVDESDSRSRSANADPQLTRNWYRYFCGPGWDPGTTTPCGIHGNGAPFHGCRNSAEVSGARLNVLSGDAELDDVVLTAYGERPSALSIVLQGPSKSTAGLPFGDGVRCVTGTLKRLYTRIAAGGTLTAPEGAELSIRNRSAALGDPIPSPGVRYYQVWYRDGPGHFNITSALQIDWP